MPASQPLPICEDNTQPCVCPPCPPGESWAPTLDNLTAVIRCALEEYSFGWPCDDLDDYVYWSVTYDPTPGTDMHPKVVVVANGVIPAEESCSTGDRLSVSVMLLRCWPAGKLTGTRDPVKQATSRQLLEDVEIIKTALASGGCGCSTIPHVEIQSISVKTGGGYTGFIISLVLG